MACWPQSLIELADFGMEVHFTWTLGGSSTVIVTFNPGTSKKEGPYQKLAKYIKDCGQYATYQFLSPRFDPLSLIKNPNEIIV